jgi:hypothetical protein
VGIQSWFVILKKIRNAIEVLSFTVDFQSLDGKKISDAVLAQRSIEELQSFVVDISRGSGRIQEIITIKITSLPEINDSVVSDTQSDSSATNQAQQSTSNSHHVQVMVFAAAMAASNNEIATEPSSAFVPER